ncbi:MAG: response regulator transcription factor [Aggregatilineales bacterium]
MAKILVIEDDSTMLLNLVEMLEFENYTALGARSGQEGLALVEADPPDLILCDVMLPDINGFQVVKTLRANPSYARIPVIFVSARAGNVSGDQVPQAGVISYVMKPFDVQDLLTTIRGVLDGAQRAAGHNA